MKTVQLIFGGLLLIVALIGCKEDPVAQEIIRPVRAVKLYAEESLGGRSLPGQPRPQRKSTSQNSNV